MSPEDLTPEALDKLRVLIEQRAVMHSTEVERTAQREAAVRRMDLVRLAKEVLVENRRLKDIDAADVAAGDIVAFAKELSDYVG